MLLSSFRYLTVDVLVLGNRHCIEHTSACDSLVPTSERCRKIYFLPFPSEREIICLVPFVAIFEN